MTNNYNKGSYERQKLTQEEKERLQDSEWFMEVVQEVYMCRNLFSTGNALWYKLNMTLKKHGLATFPSMQDNANAVDSHCERWIDKFEKYYIPDEMQATTPEEKKVFRDHKRVLNHNYTDMDKYVASNVEQALREGIKQRNSHNIRKKVGGGCDTCRKYGSNGCPYSRLINNPDAFSCMGFQKKIDNNQ